MTNCNNPFYKDNNIKYYLTFEKNEYYNSTNFISTDINNEIIIDDNEDLSDDNIKEGNSVINVTKLPDNNIIEEEKNLSEYKLEFRLLESSDLDNLYKSEDKDVNNTKIIYLPTSWKQNCADGDYINYIIEEKHIDIFFSKLQEVIRYYYSGSHNQYQNINIIYNENSESTVLLNQSNITFKDDDYITYNLLNIRDLYAYTNCEKKILDYNKVNFTNKELKEYYNKTTEKLTESTLKSLFKQIF